MCQAFSCLIPKQGSEAIWKFGVDSHAALVKLFGLSDDTDNPNDVGFAKAEIYPANHNYLEPNHWVLNIDEPCPSWLTPDCEKLAWKAHKDWTRQLYKILVRKPVVHPFHLTPPPKITKWHLMLLQEWASVEDSVGASVRASVRDSVWASVRASVEASVRASVWNSVEDSVGASVRASVRDSVWDSVRASVRDSVWASVRASVWASVEASVGASVWASVWASVGASVWASVGAFIGSFFRLPRSAWQNTNWIKTKKYPFECAVALWERGLVPSFDGMIWRLHGGKDAKVLWQGKV